MCVSELETRDIEVEFTEYLLDYEMSSSCCCPMYETLESLFLCDFASILVLLHIIRLLVVAHTHTHRKDKLYVVYIIASKEGFGVHYAN